MKKKLILFVMIQISVIACSYGQKGICINATDPNVYEVVLGNGSVRFPNCKIYLYNIWNKHTLITVSILPDIDNGEIKWDTIPFIPPKIKMINLYTESTDAINYYQDCHNDITEKVSRMKTSIYRPYFLKGQYIITTRNICLVEYYQIVNNLSINEFQQFNYITIFNHASEISKIKIDSLQNYSSKHIGVIINSTAKLLLEKQRMLYNKIVSCFWISSPPMLHAGWHYYGIEKFLFKPGVGIVGGSYKSYLKGDAGGVINSKESKFESNTKMFYPITINGQIARNFFKAMK